MILIQTLSFNEKTNSWVSFKSYLLEYGLSLNNEYFTFKQGEVWHHDEVNQYGVTVNRNNFYDKQFFSTVTPVFNDAPGSTKSFQTVNYEGSQAEVLTNHRTGVTSGTHSNTTTLNLTTSVTGLTVGQVVTGNDFTAPSDVNSPSGLITLWVIAPLLPIRLVVMVELVILILKNSLFKVSL